MFSVKSHVFGVPLENLIFFGRPLGYFFVGPGFNSMSPATSIWVYLRKLRFSLL